MVNFYLFCLLAAAACVTGSIVKTNNKNSSTFELLILHNNDMHARFEQTSQLSGACTIADRNAGKCYGGFPRVAHVVKEARRAASVGEGPPVLYLNAGDTYTGTAWFTIYKWKIAAEFINALQPDAVSLGNHEFDHGISGLTPFIENLTCPVLAANLILNAEPALQAEKNLMKSVIFQIDEVKVGVIGYLTPETKVLAIGNNVEYIDEIISLREEVARLQNESVNILIALGHSGFAKDLEIAKNVEGIDLVIGGHTNTFLWNGMTSETEPIDGPYPTIVKQASGRQVPVVQAYAYTKYLGQINLEFDSTGEIINFNGNPILLDKTVPHDPELLAMIDRYRYEVMKVSEVVVGKTSVILDANACRYKECNMGNMITDAMIYKHASVYVGEGWTDAPIAVIQRGGIRASIAHIILPATVTKGDLINVLPFDGTTMKVTINGSNILNMLEHSVERYDPRRSPGEFLHVSGLKVTYDLMKKPGQRVVKVTIRCGKCNVPEFVPLNKTKQYMILTSSFLSSGGDGYSVFKDLPQESLNFNDLSATTEYVEIHSPVYPAVEDRITLLSLDKINNAASISKSSIFSSIVMIFVILSIV